MLTLALPDQSDSDKEREGETHWWLGLPFRSLQEPGIWVIGRQGWQCLWKFLNIWLQWGSLRSRDSKHIALLGKRACPILTSANHLSPTLSPEQKFLEGSKWCKVEHNGERAGACPPFLNSPGALLFPRAGWCGTWASPGCWSGPLADRPGCQWWWGSWRGWGLVHWIGRQAWV